MTPRQDRDASAGPDRTPKDEPTLDRTPKDEPTDEPDAAATSDDLEAARLECQELMDRLQRTAADYQNFQKRVARRTEETVAFAVRDIVLDLLPVLDNFDRALEAARSEPDFEAFRRGVELVREQLRTALAGHGVEPIKADRKPFDPELHEAVGQTPTDQIEANHVADVLQTGYRLNGRTIRPSKVVVATGEEAP